MASTVLTQIRRHLRNPYLLAGAGALIVAGGLLYIVVNEWIMPTYTRHGVSITVPDVRSEESESATASIEAAGLVAETIQLRKPNLPRDIVIDQSPGPDALVKPGRRIYLTINSGDTTTVVVPNVEALPIREAQNQLVISDLLIAAVRPDSIPSAHANTITRQEPLAGARVAPRTPVSLWYSTGLGNTVVEVPDVTGLSTTEARRLLLDLRLRSVVLGVPSDPIPGEDLMVRAQSPAPGTSVREGFEIRLRLSAPTEER